MGTELVGSFTGHEDRIPSVKFTPDGNWIVSGSWDKSIRIWDAFTGDAILPALRGHQKSVLAVDVSPDSA